jgi:hypothetical protein
MLNQSTEQKSSVIKNTALRLSFYQVMGEAAPQYLGMIPTPDALAPHTIPSEGAQVLLEGSLYRIEKILQTYHLDDAQAGLNIYVSPESHHP